MEENTDKFSDHLDFIESFRDFRRDERIALSKFIQAYEVLPCLWNKNERTFTNKPFKARAYKQLAAVSKKLNPNAGSVEWVKNKINALRAVFFRDYKRVVESMDSKDMYTPRLWYFGLMLFVTEIDDENIALNNKIRARLKLGSDNIHTGTGVEFRGLVTEKEKLDYRLAISQLISVYKANPCLWNKNEVVYMDKEHKEQAYEALLQCAAVNFPGVDLEWVKAKIYKLRAVFWREYKKCKNADELGETYTPALWYYDLMAFIAEGEVKRLDQRRIPLICLGEDPSDDFNDVGSPEYLDETQTYSENSQEGFDLSQNAIESSDQSWDLVGSSLTNTSADVSDLLLSNDSSLSAEPTTTTEIMEPPKKKIKILPSEEPITIHLPEINDAFDELSAFATSTAGKLRRMAPDQRDLAELEIGKILFLGLRGRLVDRTLYTPATVDTTYPDSAM